MSKLKNLNSDQTKYTNSDKLKNQIKNNLKKLQQVFVVIAKQTLKNTPFKTKPPKTILVNQTMRTKTRKLNLAYKMLQTNCFKPILQTKLNKSNIRN